MFHNPTFVTVLLLLITQHTTSSIVVDSSSELNNNSNINQITRNSQQQQQTIQRLRVRSTTEEHQLSRQLTKESIETAWDPRMCPEVAIPPCFPESAREECIHLVEDGCVSLLTTRSCPAIFFCGKYQNETTTTTTVVDEEDEDEQEPKKFKCPLPSETCMNDETYEQCSQLKKDKCKGIGMKESCPVQFFCIDDKDDVNKESDQPSIAFLPDTDKEQLSSDVPSLSPSDVPSSFPQ